MSASRRPSRPTTFWWIAGAAVLVVAVVLSAFASSLPDGLEWTAHSLGFDRAATDGAAAGLPTADYGIAGVDDPVLSNGLAGLLGVVVVAAASLGLVRLLRGRRAS